MRTSLLESHVDQEGLKTSYSYDILGKLASEIFVTSNGEMANKVCFMMALI